MNALVVTGIVIGSVPTYLVAGYYTGRTWARYWYAIDRHPFIEGTFTLGALLWPIIFPIWAVVQLVNARRYALREALIPELRTKADEKRQRDLEYELREREHEIARLHRELGIKP